MAAVGANLWRSREPDIARRDTEKRRAGLGSQGQRQLVSLSVGDCERGWLCFFHGGKVQMILDRRASGYPTERQQTTDNRASP